MKCEDIEAPLDSGSPTFNLLNFAPIKEEIKARAFKRAGAYRPRAFLRAIAYSPRAFTTTRAFRQEPSREQEPTIQGPSREQENDNPDLPYPNEPDCYATQLLLENTNEFIVHTILKPEKTSNVPSTALCEEHIIKDELCFDESSIDVKENTIIKLSQNLTNELQINDNQLKSKTFLKIDPNLGHSGVKKYQCDYCFMVFTNKKYLKSHTSIHGRHKRSHKCGVCGKCFTKIELKIHLSNSGHRPYKCDICGKCFATKNYLKIHICTHGGQSGHGPYKCEICGRCFNKKEYLKSHLPTHSGQKPHKCDACGKCFTRKGSLTTHLLSHSGQQRSYKFKIAYWERIKRELVMLTSVSPRDNVNWKAKQLT
uniref:C2H2-type domain-containing protein n=1 Tax=Timema monikensis TaxID=170555 RepID=A0A7R9HLU5_9NEOP|nr:unnamed protein product [Timema monikensis]